MAEDFLSKVNEWSAWMSAPENRAALIQGGLAMMQPMAPGQTLGGHAAQAMSQGLAAGGEMLTEQEKRDDANRKFAIQEGRAALQDERSNLGQERFFWQQQQAERRLGRQQSMDEYKFRKDEEKEQEAKAKKGAVYLKNYTDWAKNIVGDSLESDALDRFMRDPANKARYDRMLEGDFSQPTPSPPPPPAPGADKAAAQQPLFQKGKDIGPNTVRRMVQQRGPVARFETEDQYRAALNTQGQAKFKPGDIVIVAGQFYRVK